MNSLPGKIFLTFLFLSINSNFNAAAREIYVCSSCEYKTISEALNASQDGDRIIVKKGVYKEHDLKISKQVSLIGEGKPEIDVDLKGAGIIISTSNVTVSGFKFKNVDVNYLSEPAGVRIEYTDNCVIKDNNFENTFFGIYLAGAKNCEVSNNIIAGQAKTESSSGNGIHLWKCRELRVDGNEISGHRDGIYLEFVYASSIEKNFSRENLRYGLHFMFSDSNSYSENIFERNGAGVAVMYSKYIFMKGNTFRNNWGESSYGLLLKELYDGVLEDNLFYKNTSGIHLEGSNRIEMIGNDFIENGWALNALGNSYDNKIINNNFINNTFDISSNASKSNNFYSGNYWDKYKGYDLNKDGTGDVPYRPVSLFSMILEKSPESIIMLRSIVVDLLDAVKRIVPSVIPETLIDEKPSISRNGHDRNIQPS